MATTRSAPLLKHLLTRLNPSRSVTYMPRPGDGTPRGVTLIPGDGIGPLVTGAVEQVMEAMHAPIYFEKYDVHGDMRRVPEEVLDSGGLRTPVGGGVRDLDLYASREHRGRSWRRREPRGYVQVICLRAVIRVLPPFCNK